METFVVTQGAMRPASSKEQCFYCSQPMGCTHLPECVLIKKIVRVKATIEYEIEVPHSWDAGSIEFHRNDSSWCANNMIPELERLSKDPGCLCNSVIFECVSSEGKAFLSDK